MKSLRFRQTLLSIAAIALLAALPALAKDGRDFAGVYSVGNVVEQGDQMLVTLSVQVHNHSDADVKHAVLTLRPSHPSPQAIGEFQPVKLWRNHGEVKLTQQFLVERRDFESWSKGSQPALMVVYHGAEGQRYDRYVQLRSRPALPQ